MAGGIHVEVNLQGQFSDRSVCRVLLLFDLFIFAHIISFTATSAPRPLLTRSANEKADVCIVLLTGLSI